MGRKSGLDGGSEIFSSILIKIPKNRDLQLDCNILTYVNILNVSAGYAK